MAVFKPTGTLHCVTELTPELLKALNVHMIVLDVDNTMSPHGSQTPFPGVRAWAQSVTASGVKLIVVSNNYKKRVAPFAAQFNLPFVSFACKPFPVGYLRAKKMAGTPRRECLVVGDQIFTSAQTFAECGRFYLTPCRRILPPRCASSAVWRAFCARTIRGSRPGKKR